MAKTEVKSPVKGFTGSVVGVSFVDGVGSTDDESALSYFARKGYKVGEAEGHAPETTDPSNAPGTTAPSNGTNDGPPTREGQKVGEQVEDGDRHDYPDGEPTIQWSVAELKAYIDKFGGDRKGKASKEDLLGVIRSRPGTNGTQDVTNDVTHTN